MENKELKEEIAYNTANNICRCYKCDKIINETHEHCEKPNCTCYMWRDAHYAALRALGDERVHEEGKLEKYKRLLQEKIDDIRAKFYLAVIMHG